MVRSLCTVESTENHEIKSHLTERFVIIAPRASGLSSESSFLLTEEEGLAAKGSTVKISVWPSRHFLKIEIKVPVDMLSLTTTNLKDIWN